MKILLTSTLVGGEWSASRPGKRAPVIHCIGDWLGPRAGLDDVEKGKFFTLPGLELQLSIVKPVALRTASGFIVAVVRQVLSLQW
jgi:hypothetical protein